MNAVMRTTRPAGCVKPRAELYAKILRDLGKARKDCSTVTEAGIARACGSVRDGWRLVESDGSRALLVPAAATEGEHGKIPKHCLALTDPTWAIPEDFAAGIHRMVAVTRRQSSTVAISSADGRVWLQYGSPESTAWHDCTYAREWFPCKAIGGLPNPPVLVDLRFLAGYWEDKADLSLTWTGEVVQVEAAGAWRYVVMGMKP